MKHKRKRPITQKDSDKMPPKSAYEAPQIVAIKKPTGGSVETYKNG